MSARNRIPTLIALAAAASCLLAVACGGGGGVTSGCPPNCGTPPPTNPPTPPPPASVTGKVAQYGTLTALAGASVKLGSLSTVTDAQGNYAFPNVALITSPTVLYLQISAASYATANTGAQIVSGANAIRTIALLQPNATEQTWLGQVNTDRGNNGAGPVAFDEAAMEGARLHSADMATQGYFSHWDTSGEKPYARYVQVGGVGYDEENIASGFGSTAAAEAALMSDPAHKMNIVDPNHQWVGLGVSGTSYDQEFVTLGAVHDPTDAPTSVSAGTTPTYLFRIVNSMNVNAFDIGSEALPVALTPAQLNAPPYNGAYTYPPFVPLAFSQVPGDSALLKASPTLSPADQYLIVPLALGVGGAGMLWVEAH